MRINDLVADVRARLRAGKDSCFLSDAEIEAILTECTKTIPRGKSRDALIDCAVAKVADFCAHLPHEDWRRRESA
jgi:hypothetical protein